MKGLQLEALVMLLVVVMSTVGYILEPEICRFLWRLTYPAGPWLIAIAFVYFVLEASVRLGKFHLLPREKRPDEPYW